MIDVTTLIARCRQGDALAWEALVRRHQARILGLARHYMRDPEEARDVAQEIFIRVYQRLDSFQGGEKFRKAAAAGQAAGTFLQCSIYRRPFLAGSALNRT